MDYKKNTQTFKLLTNEQIKLMEDEMIEFNMKLTRKNIKLVSKKYSIPVARALSYFESIKNETLNEEILSCDGLLAELQNIMNEIDNLGKKYLLKK